MKDERNVFERRPCDGFGPSLSALPPFAECEKDGAPTVFLASARAKAWATRPAHVYRAAAGRRLGAGEFVFLVILRRGVRAEGPMHS